MFEMVGLVCDEMENGLTSNLLGGQILILQDQ